MKNPDLLEFSFGGGCIALFGLPFLAGGLTVIGCGLFTAFETGSPFAAIPFALFGIIFAGVGSLFVFGRAGIIIDRRDGTVTSWRGFVVPLWRTVSTLSDRKWVHVTREVRRSKNSTYTVYPVRVQTSKGPVSIEESSSFLSSRGRAEQVAKFLGMGIRDASGDFPVERPAGTLDESLRDRFRRAGEKPRMPQAPEGCRVEYDVNGEEVAFEIPASGFRASHRLALVVAVLISGVIAGVEGWPLLQSRDEGRGIALVILLGFASIPLVVIGIPTITSATTRVRLLASPRGVREDRRSWFHRAGTEIPAAEMEELGIRPVVSSADSFLGGGIERVRIVSDRGMIEAGAGLTAEELEWFRGMIECLVTAPREDGARTGE